MRTRKELFTEACGALVGSNGFRLAWVGWHDPASQTLVPMSRGGEREGDLGGRSAAEAAFRDGQLRVGDGPSAAAPIRFAGIVAGTLAVVSDRQLPMTDAEHVRLVDAASALSSALDHLAAVEERERIEGLVSRERRFADSLIESMPGIFYLYNEERQFLRWNRNFETVSGYPPAAIATMRPLDFFAGSERHLLEQRIAEVFETGESIAEASFVARDGTRTPYCFSGKRIQFDGMTCLVGVGVDITERTRAEVALSKSEARFRTTLDNILEGCQLIGFDWRYLYMNDAAATQNRRPNTELLGRRMPDMWPGMEETQVFAMLRRCMEQRIALHEETEFAFPDGSKGWFDVRVQPVPEGIFVLSIDISERKRAELALRELNESLEQKVVERTLDLEAATARAESADQLKSAFLATMSHELRTPLNSILGFTGIILKGLAGPLNPEQSKQLGMVQGSARHLLDLINDVLDISKIEAGQLQVDCTPIDLRQSIVDAAASVKPLADRKNLVVRLVVAPGVGTIRSDSRRVAQILLNLLNNAIKFTERGDVTLTAEILDRAVRIRVADTGIGMKTEDLGKLFQPFRQIDSGLQRQHEGTGLGLAICSRVTSLLGGTIGVESTWGEGSTFTVTLPLDPRAGA